MSPCLKQSLKEIALHQWDKWTKCSFIQAVTSLIYLIAFVNTQGRSYEDEHEQITVIIIKSQHPADLFAKHQMLSCEDCATMNKSSNMASSITTK